MSKSLSYSAQGYKDIDKTEEDKARTNRTRVLVCGGLLTVVITISVIIGVVLNQKSMIDKIAKSENHEGFGDGTGDAGFHPAGCDSDHPMCQFYA